jgi:hypothetical protein
MEVILEAYSQEKEASALAEDRRLHRKQENMELLFSFILIRSSAIGMTNIENECKCPRGAQKRLDPHRRRSPYARRMWIVAKHEHLTSSV